MRIGVTERGDGGIEIKKVLEALKDGIVDGAIIITKRPDRLVHSSVLKKIPKNTVIHVTITGFCDWRNNIFEPGVAAIKHFKASSDNDYITDYEKLVEVFGTERVVLRVDPIIPFDPYLHRAGLAASFAAERLRISFLDLYNHVRLRMVQAGKFQDILDFYGRNLHAPLEARLDALAYIARQSFITRKNIEICGEPGMKCTGCVSERDIKAMGLDATEVFGKGNQRPACACLAVKTELLTHRRPCTNNCIYCYWKKLGEE